jgi:hypothetical protein
MHCVRLIYVLICLCVGSSLISAFADFAKLTNNDT